MPLTSHTQNYATLADLVDSMPGTHRALRVCIVTPDLLGPVKNGGIGTACTYLAYALAQYGHDVHVLFSQHGAKEADAAWTEQYTQRHIGITLAAAWDAARGTVPCFPNHEPLYMAHVVHDWLTEQADFDLVLFMEWQGHGFYAMHAKACGLHFHNTALAVVLHSPSIWHNLHNADAPAHPLHSCTWHAERVSVEMADAVISPSTYMLNWCREHKWHLPKISCVQPNILHWPPHAHTQSKPVQEVVFFGRLEYRKGLEQFCNALDILAKQKRLPKKITFMGKAHWMGEEHSVLYIQRRSQQWKGARLSIKLHCDHYAALQYLCGAGRMAVMPSVADNSPYTVYECLMAGIPFVARDVGGIAELIAADDHAATLCNDHPRQLADKIQNYLGKSPQRARLAFDAEANVMAWQAGLEALTQCVQEQPPRTKGDVPFISVCLTHYNRPALLKYAIESLLAQDTTHFEVILADDGSDSHEALTYLDTLEPLFAARGWKILRLENGYPGKARNAAADVACGNWLLFFDDDNVALPCMVSTFAKAAQHSAASLLTTAFDVFVSEGSVHDGERRERFLPTGNALAYSLVHNTLGDTTSLMRKETFGHYGGFREDYGVGHEDFELFLRLVLGDETVHVIAAPLFWYRIRPQHTSVQRATNAKANAMRSLRPFMEMWPAPLGELALMTHCMAAQQERAHAASCQKMPALHAGCGDPNTPEVLYRVAEELLQRGARTQADVLLADMRETEGHFLSTHFLRAKALQAATKGNAQIVRSLMHTLEEMECAPLERAAFHILLLETLPPRKDLFSLRCDVLAALRRDDDGTVSAALQLVRHAVQLGKEAEAASAFLCAWERAEVAYCTRRRDVAQAIVDKQFFCALHHYALHGQCDNTPWPEKHIFMEILQNDAAKHLLQQHLAHSHAFLLPLLDRAFIHSSQE